MKRVQLFEFEDFNWFPKTIRNGMTNLIMVFMKMLGTKEVLGNLIEEAKTKRDFDQIVDLGSGSGGVMPDVVRDYNAKNSASPVKLILTDLYPNQDIVDGYNSQKDEVSYLEKSVDAVDMEDAPQGLKTMVNSFHHMPPEKAKAILKSAHDNKQTILIYELTENKMPLLLWWLFLPISLSILVVMCLFMTPFVKNVTWQQILFTYLIPIIPICYAWDGQASYPRTYAFQDFDAMLSDLKGGAYKWQVQAAKKENGKSAGYYVLGYWGSDFSSADLP
jgi:hypothetical protein